MKEKITLLLLMLNISVIIAQVGIENMNPQATLDISASNQTSPSNKDGILIPRIDTFPAINPTATQNAMIVYLTTTVGTEAPGFYYWNNAITSWIPLGETTNSWDLLGNIGTVNGTNFLGTTDNQALDIRTNNIIRARFTSNGQIETLNTGTSVFLGEGAGEADDLSTNRNILIGYEAGNDITNSYNNTVVGWKAMDTATDGVNNNVAIGQSSLGALITGNSNVAIGTSSLSSITSATSNVAIGLNALSNSSSGNNNVAIGRSSGANIDANDNVFIGANADSFNSGTNGRNVIIGTRAGESGVSGSAGSTNYQGRILIGYEAGGDNGIDNTLFIENSSSTTPLIYGEFDNNILRVGGQLQIGSTDDTTTGSVYAFPTIDGTSGQVLVTDGSGNVNWHTITGGGTDTQDLSIDNTVGDLSLVNGGIVEIKTIGDSDDDTLIQVEETIDEDIIRVDIGGNEHFRLLTSGKLEILNSGNSVYIGENAGSTDPTTVDKENVMIGANAGQNATLGATSSSHGKYNTGIGFSALNNLSTGNRNTTVGHNSALEVTTGSYNVVIGTDAMRKSSTANYNAALGHDALENVNGNENTAVGYRALSGANNLAIGTARYNTAVGRGAGLRIQNGESNLFLGRNSDEFNTDGNQNTIIGTDAGATLGLGRIVSGRVLIGYRAGRSIAGLDNTLYIENSDSDTPLIGGDFTNNRLGVNINMTNTANLTHTLTVGGSLKVQTLMNLEPTTTPASPERGDVYYDNATDKVRVWTGGSWENLN